MGHVTYISSQGAALICLLSLAVIRAFIPNLSVLVLVALLHINKYMLVSPQELKKHNQSTNNQHVEVHLLIRLKLHIDSIGFINVIICKREERCDLAEHHDEKSLDSDWTQIIYPYFEALCLHHSQRSSCPG